MHGANSTNQPLPRIVFALAGGAFLMGTTEFMVAGLLPEIAHAFDVSVSRCGLLVTVFALGMVVGAPTMALLTRRLPRGRTLALALVVFAAGHVVGAASPTFAVLLASRLVSALATGTFWAVAAVVAAEAAGPGGRSRAIGVVIGGLTVANVIGVPAGSAAGQVIGWSGPFWTLAAASLIAAAMIGRLIPDSENRAASPMSDELHAIASARLWLALVAGGLSVGGVVATYAFISPLLTERTSISPEAVPLVLVGFGIGTVFGTVTGGRLGDRNPIATAFAATSLTTVTLLLLAAGAGHPAVVVPLVVALGASGYAVTPIFTAMSVQFAGPAATTASGLSTSCVNAGIACGSLASGIALDSALGPVGPPLAGAAFVAATFFPLVGLARPSHVS